MHKMSSYHCSKNTVYSAVIIAEVIVRVHLVYLPQCGYVRASESFVESRGSLFIHQLLGPPTRALLFCCCLFIFFYSARDLRRLSANRRETLPHDRKWVQFLKLGPRFGGPPPKKIGAEKHAFWRDFGRLRTSIANISGMEQDIDNRKTALQTAISPASANLIWWTLVHKRRKIVP